MIPMKKADAVLVVSVLAFSVVLGILLILNAQNSSAGWAVAERDGKEILRLSLSRNQSVRIEDGDGGCNVVTVQDGAVRVSEADCPDKICISQGEIRIPGQTIVCLPHRLLIRLEGTGACEETIDAMTN